MVVRILVGGRSQDGGGIGRVITFSPTNSMKEQQNGEQSLQNNFWSLAADIRRPEKQPIVFEGSPLILLYYPLIFIFIAI